MNHKLRILPLILVATFASCTPVENEQMSKNALIDFDYSLYPHLDWQDSLKQQESNYLLFFYSKTCTYCQEIIEDVQAFCDENIMKVYWINTRETSTTIPVSYDIDKTLGVDDVSNLFIRGTPSIIEVFKGIVVANVPGKENCLTFINDQRLHKR